MTFVTIADYEQFIYGLSDTFPSILASTLRVVRSGPAAGQVIGRLTFAHDIRLEIAELVDLDAGRLEILHYGYVAWQGEENPMNSVQVLVDELHVLDAQLAGYEHRYGILSQTFIAWFQSSRLRARKSRLRSGLCPGERRRINGRGCVAKKSIVA